MDKKIRYVVDGWMTEHVPEDIDKVCDGTILSTLMILWNIIDELKEECSREHNEQISDIYIAMYNIITIFDEDPM